MKTTILSILFVVAMSIHLPAQPPPPPPGGGHGNTSNGLPKDAPIGGGLEILLGLGIVYGGLVARRGYMIKKKSTTSVQELAPSI
jgi:hypothetical protein